MSLQTISNRLDTRLVAALEAQDEEIKVGTLEYFCDAKRWDVEDEQEAETYGIPEGSRHLCFRNRKLPADRLHALLGALPSVKSGRIKRAPKQPFGGVCYYWLPAALQGETS